MGPINRFLRRLAGIPVVLYQWFISPIMRPCCRFYPGCSEYALSAINTFGLIKGVRLACCRLLRCHPWSDGGYDPVLPDKEKP